MVFVLKLKYKLKIYPFLLMSNRVDNEKLKQLKLELPSLYIQSIITKFGS